jgi:hypothetical protein
LTNRERPRHHVHIMTANHRRMPAQAHDLIALAQKLARDAERHAILSQSLASQADRLLNAGLRLLDCPQSAPPNPHLHP